jgi:hypothetical protein
VEKVIESHDEDVKDENNVDAAKSENDADESANDMDEQA